MVQIPTDPNKSIHHDTSAILASLISCWLDNSHLFWCLDILHKKVWQRKPKNVAWTQKKIPRHLKLRLKGLASFAGGGAKGAAQGRRFSLRFARRLRRGRGTGSSGGAWRRRGGGAAGAAGAGGGLRGRGCRGATGRHAAEEETIHGTALQRLGDGRSWNLELAMEGWQKTSKFQVQMQL